jgi:hypothetical protein
VFDVGPPKTCQKFEIQCGQQVYNVTHIVELMEQCNLAVIFGHQS